MRDNLFKILPAEEYWIHMEIQEDKAMKILKDMELVFTINNMTTNINQRIVDSFLSRNNFVKYAYTIIVIQVYLTGDSYLINFPSNYCNC